MVGIVTRPIEARAEQRQSSAQEWLATARDYRFFLLFVVLPTLVTAIYLYGFATDQYESGADFVVRQADKPNPGPSAGSLLGFSVGGGGGGGAADASLVNDYMQSVQAVDRLRHEDGLVTRFRRPFIDPLSRLWYADPKLEQLRKYYRRQVKVRQDQETGITHLTVHAFTPGDARDIAAKLLALGEQRINEINARSYRDSVQHSEDDLRRAENELALAETRLTTFRQQYGDIDPEGTGKGQITLVTNLTQQLSLARANMQEIARTIGTDSPQYRATANQVSSLEAQIAGQSGRLTGSDASVANRLGRFENLVVRREAAAKNFATATGLLEMAKAEAGKKQLYLVRVVDVWTPTKPEFPRRGIIVLTLFATLALAYGIGKMIVAGIREHHI